MRRCMVELVVYRCIFWAVRVRKVEEDARMLVLEGDWAG